MKETARALQIISGVLAYGLLMLAGAALWQYRVCASALPSPLDLKAANTLTAASMAMAFTMTILSEHLWRCLLAGGPPRPERVSAAFIARLACREAAGLLGCVAALRAASSGVLRAYPAYWVDLAPTGLLLVFLAVHWPSAERLSAEASDALGPL